MEESSKMLIANRAVQFGEDVTARNHNRLLGTAPSLDAPIGVKRRRRGLVRSAMSGRRQRIRGWV